MFNIIYYSRFAKDQFYNVMLALPSLIYFQTSGKLMLEINSEMLSKSFNISPFLPFFNTCIGVRVPVNFAIVEKCVDGTSMCMSILTLVLRISLSH